MSNQPFADISQFESIQNAQNTTGSAKSELSRFDAPVDNAMKRLNNPGEYRKLMDQLAQKQTEKQNKKETAWSRDMEKLNQSTITHLKKLVGERIETIKRMDMGGLERAPAMLKESEKFFQTISKTVAQQKLTELNTIREQFEMVKKKAHEAGFTTNQDD